MLARWRGTRRRRELLRRVGEVPFWYHSIDLGDDVVTPGLKSPESMQAHLQVLELPDLRDKTVLDIGAWDGFFSFEAERRGARRVVSLDHYVWSLDLTEIPSSERPKPWEPVWRPDDLPGKRGFDIARDALGSEVEPLVADFMTIDLAELGTFDVVLYSGVLYHMQNPFQALERVARVTGELAIIETQAIVVPELANHALWEFYEGDELNADPTNWWAPSEKALLGLCRAAGFQHAEIRWRSEAPSAPGLHRLRVVAHARPRSD
jgi:tRNA (mo5U34)-methyltransferase